MLRVDESLILGLCYENFLNGPVSGKAHWARLKRCMDRLPARRRPLISILTPASNVREKRLLESVESVRAQIYPHWELCLVDAEPNARRLLLSLRRLARQERRIRLCRYRRTGRVHRATDRLSFIRGQYIAFLDPRDTMTRDALAQVALALSRQPSADMLYSDEDRIDASGRRSSPLFKPDWSPDTLLSTMYIGRLLVVRTALAMDIEGVPPGFEKGQDYDWALRLTEKTAPENIVHIPKILYSRREVPVAGDSGARRALLGALGRRGIAGSLEKGGRGYFRVRRKIEGVPRVSILIPFRDRVDLLKSCLGSIRARTLYSEYELILIDNGSVRQDTLRLLAREARISNVRILRLDEPFNHSRLNNKAAHMAAGEHLLFLNNDTEVLDPRWLEAMLEHSQRPEVGAVGAKLLYGDGRIQHAGVILGAGGVAANAYRGLPDLGTADFANAGMVRNCSAVTAACLMTRKALFLESGGLNERALPVGFNDVDYCLRLREKGYLIVYTPYARLKHHESASRNLANDPRWEAYMHRRWGKVLRDPYYNPNLDLETAAFRPSFAVPRRAE